MVKAIYTPSTTTTQPEEVVEPLPNRRSLSMQRRARKLTREDFDNRNVDPLVYERLDAVITPMGLDAKEMDVLFKEFKAWHQDSETRNKQKLAQQIKEMAQAMGIDPSELSGMLSA